MMGFAMRQRVEVTYGVHVGRVGTVEDIVGSGQAMVSLDPGPDIQKKNDAGEDILLAGAKAERQWFSPDMCKAL